MWTTHTPCGLQAPLQTGCGAPACSSRPPAQQQHHSEQAAATRSPRSSMSGPSRPLGAQQPGRHSLDATASSRGSRDLQRRGSAVVCGAGAGAAAPTSTPSSSSYQQLEAWLEGKLPAGSNLLYSVPFANDAVAADPGAPTRLGFATSAEVKPGDVLTRVPEGLCVTRVDADAHPLVGPIAEGRGEVAALALWLIAEQAEGGGSAWAPLLSSLPADVESPVLWPDAERAELLQGSPMLAEARAREAAMADEWASIEASAPGVLPAAAFNARAFQRAVITVLAGSVYLPSAQCLALVPLVGALQRTGRPSGAAVDYDAASACVVLTAAAGARPGQEVALLDGRPNGELLLATGRVERDNPSDYLLMRADLVVADKLFTMKKATLEAAGLGVPQEFPVFRDAMPTQLLTYVRFARITDPAEMAKLRFDVDTIISPNNEYETLQLLMGDCRERLQGYAAGAEEDMKLLQGRELGRRARLACALRFEEKKVLGGTMDALRRRLAPIRGIPTKSGAMVDPNADLTEIFDMMEAIPKAPKKLLDGLMSWARGEQDPDWR